MKFVHDALSDWKKCKSFPASLKQEAIKYLVEIRKWTYAIVIIHQLVAK